MERHWEKGVYKTLREFDVNNNRMSVLPGVGNEVRIGLVLHNGGNHNVCVS